MSGHETFLIAVWPSGVCHFCGVPDAEVDGDRRRWVTDARNVCSDPGCIRAFHAAVDLAEGRATKRARKRSPAEVHAQIVEEERIRRRRYRAAAKARKQGRVA